MIRGLLIRSTGNLRLARVEAASNNLAAVDVSKCPDLAMLGMPGNNLAEMDVSHNPALTFVDLSYNRLTTLNVGGASSLTYLGLYDDPLTDLMLPEGWAIDDVNLDVSQLSGLHVTSTNANDA